jgi:hypothetical protein
LNAVANGDQVLTGDDVSNFNLLKNSVGARRPVAANMLYSVASTGL